MRGRWSSWVVIACALGLARPVDAAPPTDAGRRISVPAAPQPRVAPDVPRPAILYLERCAGGCRVTKGPNDAARYTSTIPQRDGTATVGEFRSDAGAVGPAADADWAALVQCMREVYSPYAIEVTDVRPSAPMHVAVIAGIPSELGLASDILGIAPLATDCSAQDNVMSFSFANIHPATGSRLLNVCWTAAQESAHAFGLDHQYAFVDDGRSACSDPMTYRSDCGGQKFFRDELAVCGETAARDCKCSEYQSSHATLLRVFGAGASIVPPPEIDLELPATGATGLGREAIAVASSRRGVARVELRLNGSRWADVPGVAFGPTGQRAAAYAIPIPIGVPDGIIDVAMRAVDDLGAATDTAVVTVTQGAPCTSADSCLPEQRCEAGRCLWDPASGEIGEACTYAQFCLSGVCRGTADHQICTEECVPGTPERCPGDLVCTSYGNGRGICFEPQDAGCCSAGGPARGSVMFAAGVLALVLRRRRRSRAT